MIDAHSVSLASIVKEFDLQVVHASSDFNSIRITVEDISRPGIQLSGYFDHFDPDSIQKILGDYTLIVCPAPMEAQVHEKVPGVDTLAVVPDQFYEDGPMEVDTVPAYNIDKDFHPEEAGWFRKRVSTI